MNLYWILLFISISLLYILIVTVIVLYMHSSTETVLLFNLFETYDKNRNKELKQVFEKNLSNPKFDIIFLIIDANVNQDNYNLTDPRIVILPFTCRPTYRLWFEYIQNLCKYHNRKFRTILCNSDIYIPPSGVDMINKTNNSYALSRWDVKALDTTALQNAKLNNNPGSHDTWVLNFPLNEPDWNKYDFNLGVWQCDQRIAHLIKNDMKVELTNPSKILKTYHYHTVEIKRDSKIIDGDRIDVDLIDKL